MFAPYETVQAAATAVSSPLELPGMGSGCAGLLGDVTSAGQVEEGAVEPCGCLVLRDRRSYSPSASRLGDSSRLGSFWNEGIMQGLLATQPLIIHVPRQEAWLRRLPWPCSPAVTATCPHCLRWAVCLVTPQEVGFCGISLQELLSLTFLLCHLSGFPF